MQHHKYSLTEIENMMPWERDIYVDMLITYLKEEKEKQKQTHEHTSLKGQIYTSRHTKPQCLEKAKMDIKIHVEYAELLVCTKIHKVYLHVATYMKATYMKTHTTASKQSTLLYI